MYKAYKFRLYPDSNQRIIINKMLGCSRYIYNHYLSKMKDFGYVGAYTNIMNYTSNLKYKDTFLQEVDSIIIRQALFNLDNAFQKMFKEHSGYPRYKNKYNKSSYNTCAIYGKYKDKEYCNIEVDLNERIIKLPKLKWLKIRGYRNLNKIVGKIKNATVERESNGKYYVSVLYEQEDIKYKVIPKNVVGIDLGVKKLLTLSDGTSYDNNKYILKYEKRIKRKQRELSRKVKRSNNYYKCKKELARLYSKLTNSRKYYIHKITKSITDEYDIITCEKLHTKNMIMEGTKNHLSKSITDASFNEILRQLLYKSRYKGKYFYQVDEYYPSSQICSVCDHQDKAYKDLNKREYKCNNCGMTLDRDFNASINIMFFGVVNVYKKLLGIA